MTHPAPEAVEIYPSELTKIQATLADLQSYWLQKRVDDPADAAEAFNQMAVNKFGEIGFEVKVDWLEAKTKDGEVHNPFAPGVPLYVPEVSISGRTRKEEEVDHDRLQSEITSGLVDGRKGFIREDGSWHEEPIKKIIL